MNTSILPQPRESAAPHSADGVPRCPRCHQATLDYSSVVSCVRCATCDLWLQLTPAQNDDYACMMTGIDPDTDPSLFLAALVTLDAPAEFRVAAFITASNQMVPAPAGWEANRVESGVA